MKKREGAKNGNDIFVFACIYRPAVGNEYRGKHIDCADFVREFSDEQEAGSEVALLAVDGSGGSNDSAVGS